MRPGKSFIPKRRRYMDWDDVPMVMGVADVCMIFDCCDATVRKLLTSGAITGRRLGKQWLIDRESVREYVNGKGAIL